MLRFVSTFIDCKFKYFFFIHQKIMTIFSFFGKKYTKIIKV